MGDKVIAVTGGFGALGRAVVGHLADRGFRPAAVDMGANGFVDGAALELGGVDAADPGAAEAAIASILHRFGRLDGLINIAGGFSWETLEDGALDTWDSLYRSNVRTAVAMSRAAIAHLPRPGGAIVNVGAAAAAKAGAGMGAYTAAKSGVARLTEALAEELKDSGIRVNAVLPSIIDTPANRADMADADFERWVSAGSLAKVIFFLISEDAESVTGALIPVTGRV
jgi:NAD(P)-dependent dehydrogenase (short-subunit alcohol dehydrogenase family)